eukprot:5443599-Amphidinium_carterae.1
MWLSGCDATKCSACNLKSNFPTSAKRSASPSSALLKDDVTHACRCNNPSMMQQLESQHVYNFGPQ